MNELARPLAPVSDFKPMLTSHWQVMEIKTEHGIHYDVVRSDGGAVASNIRRLELARLFALSPQLFNHFKSLLVEVTRVLYDMVDCDATQYDLQEIAEDIQGDWERVSQDAPAFASWLLAMEELEEMVGPQTYPPEGVSGQYELFAD